MSTKFEEPIIEKKDYKPEFHIKQITVPSSFGGSNSTYTVEQPIMVLKSIDGKLINYELSGKPFGRFLGFHEIGRRRFLGMSYRKEEVTSKYGAKRIKKIFIGTDKANDWILSKYEKIPTEKFKLLIADGKVERITSEKYIGVPHDFIQEIIEKRLKAEGLVYEKQIEDARFIGSIGRYVIKNVKKGAGEIAKTISYWNQNSGDKSLKFYGGAVVLVCSNGMVREESKSKIRLLHKIALPVLKKKIENALGLIIQQLEPLQKEFTALQKIKVTREEAKIKIESLPVPKYVQKAIWTRLFTASKFTKNGEMDFDGTMWGLYMASTYIASHYEKIEKGRRERAVTDEQYMKLSSLELFTTKWDKKEKETDKTNAQKVEVSK